MDGVIIDSNPFHKKALDIFLSKYNIQLSENERKIKLYGRANKDWINEVFGGNLTDAEVQKLGDEKEMYWREVYKNDIKPVKGLVDFLNKLKEKNFPYAIGTSAPFENVEFTLKNCNLTTYFDVILDQRHVNKGKPNPEIYINCAKKLGVLPQHCVVIEDSIAGVQAGLAAGCKVIGITTTHTASELLGIHKSITDFDELEINDLKNLILD